MQWKNTEKRWGVLAQTFHWLIFILFVSQFYLAEFPMENAVGADRYAAYGLHKSIGMLVLFVVFARLSWRNMNPAPKAEKGMTEYEEIAATTMHYMLYAMMFMMPVSGYLMSTAGGHDISFFGLFLWPDLVAESKALGGWAHRVHEYCATLIYVLVAVHALAALWHHFIRKDNTLKRMLPKCCK